ncbi:MAG: M4 family metallopeptidase [Verrucomicrobia bacterium]|nr:M4 family metallopeptidase [Verrucomicrobiota bacterium]
MPASLNRRLIALITVLAVCCVIVWRFHNSAPSPGETPKRTIPPLLNLLLASSNAPAFTAKAVQTPISAITNAALKDLISAAAQFQTRAAKGQPVNQRKLYTADKPLPAQEAALLRLQAQSDGTLQAYLRQESYVPIQLKGHPLAGPDPAAAGLANADEVFAHRFMQENRDVFLLNEPDNELRLNHREKDSLGRTVLRFTQMYQSLEVWPGEIGVHLDPAGAIDLVHTTTVPTPDGVEVTPQISAEQATQRARAKVPGGSSGTATEAKLLIYAPLDQSPKLAWKFELSVGLAHHWLMVVDARTGDTLKAANMCMCANVAGSGVDLLGMTRPLRVEQENGTNYMLDTSKPMFNPLTGNGLILIAEARNATLDQIFVGGSLSNLYFVTSTSPNSWTNADAVSAAYNFSQAYDYYYEQHQRDSFNGKGSNLIATVRIGNLTNAFWHPGLNWMFFGNGDRFTASLDVIGHELTHGVTRSVGTNGVLDYEKQSGALNESFSDIFGEMMEARSNGGTPDWLLGAVLNRIVRNMSNPPAFLSSLGVPYPQKMSEFITTTNDHGGVHINSSIFNRAYYLIASGLSGSLGLTNAEKIFYRCLTTKLLPQSQFVDARLGCIAAAEELFPTNPAIALKVAEGFDAIELFAAPATLLQSPTNLPPITNSQDSTIWVYWDTAITNYSLARRETARGDLTNGTQIASNIKLRRPAVTGDGSLVAYVTSTNTLALLDTIGGIPSISGSSGQVHSVAFSPSSNFAALVLRSNGLPTSQIRLVDFVKLIGTTIDLKTPVFDSSSVNNINFATSMCFSPDGKQLAFDALSTAVDPTGKVYSAFVIYTMNTETFEIKALSRPDQEIQALNPVFSRNSSRYLMFEAIYGANSYVVNRDLEKGTAVFLTNSAPFVSLPLTFPSFTTDDSAILYADSDANVYRQPLSADKMSPSGARTRWVNNSPVGVIYRRGTYTATNAPPVVSITSPPNGSVFTSPAAFTLGVSVSDPDPDGGISKVEIYDGNRLVGQKTSPPFDSFPATNFGAGLHRYYARAYDNRGASTTSIPIRIGIKPSQSLAAFNSIQPSVFEMSLATPTNGVYRLEASTNLVDWISLGSFESLSGALYNADLTATNYPRRFYRAVKVP